MAHLILLYKGATPNSEKIKRTVKALQNERRKKKHRLQRIDYDAIFGPKILKHIFAREFGWTHQQSGKMYLDDAIAELELILQDKERERKENERRKREWNSR